MGTYNYKKPQVFVESIQGEDWKDVPGFGGNYQISSKGRVKSIERLVPVGSAGGFMLLQEKILVQGLSAGYPKVELCCKGRQSSHKVHTLVANAFLPKSDETLVVNHVDGNKLNNLVENLEWVTHRQNLVHAVATGLRVPIAPRRQPHKQETKDKIKAARIKYWEKVRYGQK